MPTSGSPRWGVEKKGKRIRPSFAPTRKEKEEEGRTALFGEKPKKKKKEESRFLAAI